MHIEAPTFELQDNPAAPQTSATPAPAGGPATTSSTGAPGTPPAAPGGFFGGFGSLLPLLAIFAVFYFVMIGPERKARKKREQMLREIKKGDRVLTTSGMYATVAALNENEVTLQISDDVRARFTRAAIQSVESDSVVTKDAK